jgi:hypothetical protein
MKLFFTIPAYILFFIFAFQVNAQNLINGPDDLVFDLKYNRILVGNWAGNRIIAIDSNGIHTVYKTGLQYCHGMEILGDTVYIASADKIYLVNINNAETIRSITIPGSSRLGHITLDTYNYILYVSDWSVEKIYKVNLNSNTTSLLMDTGNGTPVGILFDGNNNRLILMTFGPNIPIKSVNVQNGQVSNITNPIYNYLDAIIKDRNDYIYFTSFTQGIVYKIDTSFTNPPEIISTGHNGPSGLGYNKISHILGVTNYNSNSISLITLPNTGIRKLNNNNIVKDYELYQNYPNPFNPSTIIKFGIKKNGYIKLKVLDILGKEIETLINERLQAGKYEVTFVNSLLPNGIYFYRLEADGFQDTKRMILIK